MWCCRWESFMEFLESIRLAGGQRLQAYPVAGKLFSAATIAVATGLRPADRLFFKIVVSSPHQLKWRRIVADPVAHHIQIVVLAEGIKRQPQAKTVRQVNFVLHRFARVQLAIVAALPV